MFKVNIKDTRTTLIELVPALLQYTFYTFHNLSSFCFVYFEHAMANCLAFVKRYIEKQPCEIVPEKSCSADTKIAA